MSDRLQKWIVGLGNPGRRYALSRHNAGFWVIDRFAKSELYPAERRKFRALYTEKVFSVDGESFKVYLAKPQTYMNLSGSAVRDLLGFFGVDRSQNLADQLLVVYDDVDVPLGRVRFRAQGSAGGHRGVASVISCLGHSKFGRLKIGVGRPRREGDTADGDREPGDREPGDTAQYVLETLTGRAKEQLAEVSTQAVYMLSAWVTSGIQGCMNRFNGPAVLEEETGGDAAKERDITRGSAPHGG